MAAADFAAIRDAIFATLRPLLGPSSNPATPLALLDDWCGDLTAATENLSSAVLNQTPAALVAFQAEQKHGGFEALSGAGETVGDSTWAVIVVTTDAGPVAHGITGPAGVPGVLALADTVLAALDALPIAGLYRRTTLRYRDTRWYAVRRGALYAMAVRFDAVRQVLRVRPTDGSAPLNEIDADLDTGDPATDPRDRLVATTT